MKKLVVVLLSFSLLFSTAVSGVATESDAGNKPTVYIRYEMSGHRNEQDEYVRTAYVHVEVFACPDFEKCEIVMAEENFNQCDPFVYAPLWALQYYSSQMDVSHSVNSTNTTLAVDKDDAFFIRMQTPLSGNLHPYAHIMFEASDASVLFNPVFESVKLFDAYGEVADFEVKTITQIGQSVIVPDVCGELSFASVWNTDSADPVANPYGSMDISVSANGVAFITGMEAVLLYNPEVLQLEPKEIAEDDAEEAYYANAEYELLEPGRLRIFYDGDFCSLRMPFVFACIAQGESGLAIESYTWLYYEHTANYVYYSFDEYIMRAADYEVFDDMPANAVEWKYDKNVWFINEGLTVKEFRESVPAHAVADVIVYNVNGEEMSDDEIVGTGCKYKVFYAGRQYFVRTLYVRFDVDGDGYLTAADARYALRVSVGLEEKPTKAQLYASEMKYATTFHADHARTLLRHSVGL